MKRLLLALMLIATPAVALEQVDLNKPYDPDTRTFSSLKVGYMILHRLDGFVEIGLTDGTEIIKRVRYQDTTTVDENGDTIPVPTATNLMNTLNKMDLSSNSANKRILNKLITDGHLAGTVSGTPE